ncbi:SEC14-like protein 2 isoform X1 [Centruroides sculpturatus]|uniref:SEC14-like protein 2 isoform X1 n=2 Tax=Centruroides sculpturatus TaxID=218467 RepID=UPI000C6CD433|nr:SEC14-like protein 2 isoform X1 [Centruroides sculpturatus]
MASLDKLTPIELQTLHEFRKSVGDVLQSKHDDAFLLRWLRARDFRLKDAEDMLRKHLTWRVKNKIDNILKEYTPPEVLRKYWSLGFLGYDQENCPLWLCRYGLIDFKGIIYSAKKSDVIMFYAYLLELSESKMREQTKKTGKLVDKHSYIFDMENFVLQQVTWKPCFDLLSKILTFYEDNYPERLKAAYFINAPFVFQIALALLKPFISDTSYSKIQVFGKDDWKDVLLTEIDASDLPVRWGGTKVGVNGEPDCSDIISPGGIVPKSYYLQESQSFTNENDVETLEIGLKSSATVDIYISESDAILQWEFKTENHDIGFGLFYKSNEHMHQEELIPIDRVNCHLVPETGSWFCENEGICKYILL